MKVIEKLWKPVGYRPALGLRETEVAMKNLKHYFEEKLVEKLNLTNVSAPLYVRSETGVNDNLNGVERPVTFEMKELADERIEIVHSLAKWKRTALSRYGFAEGEGIITDMKAIRRDEELDNLHSIYVDQWDWELVIPKEQRTVNKLKEVVTKIYQAFLDTEEYISEQYPDIEPILPKEIYFLTSQELEDLYPSLTPKQREDQICRQKGAVFLMQIGDALRSGQKHDSRSPDYDDWQLNGDILFWHPVLEMCIELSSMGIRVDEEALTKQLQKAGCQDRMKFEYHQLLMEGKLPYTIGGGIGQSRVCMYFLRKAHVGEVQVSVWPNEMIQACEEIGILLL